MGAAVRPPAAAGAVDDGFTTPDPRLWGVVKADIGCANGRICGDRKAGKSRTPPQITEMASRSSSGRKNEAIAGEGHNPTGRSSTPHPLHLPQQMRNRRWLPGSPPCWRRQRPGTAATPPPAHPAPSTWAAMPWQAAEGLPVEPGLLGQGQRQHPRSPRRADSSRRLHPQTPRRRGNTLRRHRLLFNTVATS